MPYILQAQRDHLIDHNRAPNNVGELTYVFAAWANKYLEDFGLSYQTISEIKAALHGTLDDFHDRVVRPYEKQKRKANGDVWTVDV